MHADAIKLEKLRLASQKSGGIVQALETQVELGRTVNEENILAQEIPHTTNLAKSFR